MFGVYCIHVGNVPAYTCNKVTSNHNDQLLQLCMFTNAFIQTRKIENDLHTAVPFDLAVTAVYNHHTKIFTGTASCMMIVSLYNLFLHTALKAYDFLCLILLLHRLV